jgi:hypothetical protein
LPLPAAVSLLDRLKVYEVLLNVIGQVELLANQFGDVVVFRPRRFVKLLLVQHFACELFVVLQASAAEGLVATHVHHMARLGVELLVFVVVILVQSPSQQLLHLGQREPAVLGMLAVLGLFRQDAHICIVLALLDRIEALFFVLQ